MGLPKALTGELKARLPSTRSRIAAAIRDLIGAMTTIRVWPTAAKTIAATGAVRVRPAPLNGFRARLFSAVVFVSFLVRLGADDGATSLARP